MTTRRATLALALTLAAGAAAQPQATTAERVERLLSRMTLAEKAGQMSQLNMRFFTSQKQTPTTTLELDMDKVREAFVRYHVGTAFGVWEGPHTVERWRELVEAFQSVAVNETRLGIPIIFANDSVHGANFTVGATIFPQSMNLAATWDLELAERAAEITAIETRASATHWNFAPVADVARHQAWPRFQECFGEDPLLASAMVAAQVRGMQGGTLDSDRTVAATAKHFIGYSLPRSGLDRTPAYISPAEMADTFVPPFVAAFEEGVASIMINSGEVNGVPTHADPRLLTGLLRDRLGFEGIALTDFYDVRRLPDVHRVAVDRKDGLRLATLAGVDVQMVATDTDHVGWIVELVNEGHLSESRIDDSVRRMLTMKFDLGLFEDPIGGASSVPRVGSEAHRAVNERAAERSLVLLKNEGDVLPLAEDADILVTGPTADDLPALHGSWTYTWQGTDPHWYPDEPTVLDAMRTRFGEAAVTHVPGTTYDEAIDIAEAARAANRADVVVLCLGEMPVAEKPGDLDDLDLDDAQLELARAVIDTGTPVVLVMIANRPRIINDIADDVAAIVWAGQPGPTGGPALARMLAGDVNPSGHLPFTWPYDSNVLVTYDRKSTEDIDRAFEATGAVTQFDFGDGLSYTTFDYGDLVVEPVPGGLVAEVTIENTGERPGTDVTQVYVTDEVASVTPHARRLKAFERVELAPGERRRLRFELDRRDLSFGGRDGQIVFEPGDFTVRIGVLSKRVTVR